MLSQALEMIEVLEAGNVIVTGHGDKDVSVDTNMTNMRWPGRVITRR